MNSELPAAVRCLSVDQFNRGRYKIIIASDEKALEKPDGGILPLEERSKKKQVLTQRIYFFNRLFYSLHYEIK